MSRLFIGIRDADLSYGRLGLSKGLGILYTLYFNFTSAISKDVLKTVENILIAVTGFHHFSPFVL